MSDAPIIDWEVFQQARSELGADFIRNVRGVGYFVGSAAPAAGPGADGLA